MATTRAAPHPLGTLCVGGDWARAHGDFETLRCIAQQLAGGVAEPLHCDLMELADLCLYDLDTASASWDLVKHRLLGSSPER